MEENKEILKKEYEIIVQRLIEYTLIKNLLTEIKKQEETYIHIGGMIFAKGKILDDQNFLVNIGENVYIEKSRDELLNIISNIISQLERRKKEIEEELSK